jgi:hypothetical protein
MGRELESFMEAVRETVPEQPDSAFEPELIRRLAETARLGGTAEAFTRPAPVFGSRRALIAKTAVAVAVIPVALAGLAFAGVNLPDPARSAFESVGVSLPNQSDGDEGGGAAEPAGKQSSPSDGTKSSQGNSDAAHQHALEQRRKAQGKAIGHERGKAIGLKDLEPPGQTGDTGALEHSNAGGSERSTTTPGKVRQTSPPESRGSGKGLSK